jgi:hypothetical protein
MNKKSQFDTTKELLLWIPRIILLVIIVGTVFYIITLPIKKNFQTDELQQNLLKQRFVYNENCLAYKDDRIYPGIIDIKKFDKENLEKCFQNNKIGVTLNLVNETIKTIRVNEKIAEKDAFCFDTKHFFCTNYTYYVMIKNEKIEPGLLNVHMIKIK